MQNSTSEELGLGGYLKLIVDVRHNRSEAVSAVKLRNHATNFVVCVVRGYKAHNNIMVIQVDEMIILQNYKEVSQERHERYLASWFDPS